MSLICTSAPTLPLFAGMDLYVPEQPVKAKRARRPSATETLPWLEVALFDLEGEPTEEAAIADDLYEDSFEAVDLAQVEESRDAIQWSTDDVAKLHSHLLEQSLRALAGRGNAIQKQEILDWIFEPDFVGTTTRNGREIPVYTNQIPWSFAFCCRMERMDPETFRTFLLSRMPEQLRRYYI